MDQGNNSSGYGKRPWWHWILIYLIIGAVAYGLIYYFVLSKKGGYNDNVSFSTQAPIAQTATPQDSASATTTEQNTITLSANGFSPATLTVKAGTKVTWINQSGSDATVNSNPHPAHSDYPPLNLGRFPAGGELFLVFDQPGTYGYHNHLDPAQTGKIIVQ